MNGGGSITAPWVYEEGNSMNIHFNIKKGDGWIMLSHTMLEQTSLEPNYILLYNPKRGIIKGFYYNRENVPNSGFLWVMESEQPTSSLKKNKLVQNVNKSDNYMTTSNIIEDSKFEFGHLNGGWNAFSFELIYSDKKDNDPKIKIYGYNNQESTITLSGKYSGEVIIPIPKEDKTGLDSFLTGVENLNKIFGHNFIIPDNINPTNLIKKIGAAYGSANTFLSVDDKTGGAVTKIRAQSKGTIELKRDFFHRSWRRYWLYK